MTFAMTNVKKLVFCVDTAFFSCYTHEKYNASLLISKLILNILFKKFVHFNLYIIKYVL